MDVFGNVQCLSGLTRVFVLKVLCNILAADGVNDPDVLAINGGMSGSALLHMCGLCVFMSDVCRSFLSVCGSGSV